MYSGPLYKSCQACPWGQKWPCPAGSLAPGVHTGHAPGASWEKHKKNLLLLNQKAQSFHILYVAMFSGPLYKSCQACPWGQKWPCPAGSLAPIDLQWEKHKKNLLRNHKAQSFHILCVAMYSGLPTVPLGSIQATPQACHYLPQTYGGNT